MILSHLLFLTRFCVFLLLSCTVGSVYYIEDSLLLGYFLDVCGTQDPFPPRLNICQIEICLKVKEVSFSNRWKEWGICRETVGALPIQFCRTLFGKLCYTCFLNFSADNDNAYSNMEPPCCHSLSNQLLEHLCFCHLCAYPMNFICRSGCRKRPI